MQERYLPVVIEMMINEIPITPDNGDLIHKFISIRESALYSAPEAMYFWWDEISNELSFYFPDPNNLNDWQTKIIKIWMNEKN